MPEFKSSNFEFLLDLSPSLVHQAAMAERYCLDDPNAAQNKIRFFGEPLLKNITARFYVYNGLRFINRFVI